ncbi:hypothetical protein DVS28_b0244 (plasmid) [Euzebya pacifica]|uniref:Uncharacterized protein n=1 Tax=Euzebya pacifica TaxID=1608957 RepID=A0A346Y6B7_9ACTN|nr:hypothetical protein [Euzebya pacifica]AXV10014.1 hypothetical protein DVS28_b0244 [Euzebya pacifica]
MTADELATKVATGTPNEIMASNARMLRDLADAFDRGIDPTRPVTPQIIELVNKTANLLPSLVLGNLTELAVNADQILGHLAPAGADDA